MRLLTVLVYWLPSLVKKIILLSRINAAFWTSSVYLWRLCLYKHLWFCLNLIRLFNPPFIFHLHLIIKSILYVLIIFIRTELTKNSCTPIYCKLMYLVSRICKTGTRKTWSTNFKMSRNDRRNRGLELGVLLLFNELFSFGFGKVPPVTLLSIIGQVSDPN